MSAMKRYFDPHGGVVIKNKYPPYYRDFDDYKIDSTAITVDHLIYQDGSVDCHVNGTKLEDLP